MEANETRLRAVLARNRLQQKDVADALSLSRMSVWSWVDGRTVPTGINLIRLLEYLRQFEPTLQAEDLLPAAAALVAPASDPAVSE
jgi:transcriptional regulator with XRE-family HTH domain